MDVLAQQFGGKKQFAERIGVSAGTVHNWVKGKPPTGDVLRAILTATGVDAAWLLTGVGEPFPTAPMAAAEQASAMRQMWEKTLVGLIALADVERSLAPMISPTDAGDVRQVGAVVAGLHAAIEDLCELARQAGLELPYPDRRADSESVMARRAERLENSRSPRGRK